MSIENPKDDSIQKTYQIKKGITVSKTMIMA